MGSKVSDKLLVIDNLLKSVDRLIIGGGMCFTFLAAEGRSVTRCSSRTGWTPCLQILKDARERSVRRSYCPPAMVITGTSQLTRNRLNEDQN